jgi:hypothetical protein
MAAVSVFVDDAILGRLPLVCAKTGEPADLLIRIRQPVGGRLSPLLLLLLVLGPFGIGALLLMALFGPAPEYLTVRVPQTDVAWHHERLLERLRLAAFGAGVALCLGAIVRPGILPGLWLACGAVLVVAGASLHVMVLRQQIGVSLDASRRWVTLTGVLPTFVEAVGQRQLAGER